MKRFLSLLLAALMLMSCASSLAETTVYKEQGFAIDFSTVQEHATFYPYLKNHGVQATFHYLPLHSSKYYQDKHDGRVLANCDRYADTLMRLPLYYELTDEEIDKIVKLILKFKY
jgi:dTDP-4-amino-4,6-dideoxygalactose transaminase